MLNAMKRRVIAVVTGTRAELGILRPVMRAIADRDGLTLRTVVAGMHLVTGTWRELRGDGLGIDARVPMQSRGEVGREADVRALGRGVAGVGAALTRLRPDVVLVLGDRIEALAGALAAAVGGLRVAHVHGGDRAEGVADESMRHAISKLAHLHFPATATSRRRLLRLGEAPASIHMLGSPAVDGLAEVVASPEAPELIVLQHPIGERDERERGWMEQTLAACAGRSRLVLCPNADPGSVGIQRAIDEARARTDPRARYERHLPRDRWLALLAGARAIVGNSSAGLIEAAALGVPAVNVGPRQAGRERPGSVVDCDYGTGSVRAALARALKLPRRRRHPYGRGDAGLRIAQALETLDLEAIPLRKRNTY